MKLHKLNQARSSLVIRNDQMSLYVSDIHGNNLQVNTMSKPTTFSGPLEGSSNDQMDHLSQQRSSKEVASWLVGWLNAGWFNAEMSPKSYWRDRDPGGWGGGDRRGRGGGVIYLMLLHQDDSCIRTGSGESHFNVSLIVNEKIGRRCPQTTTFEEKGEPKRF